MYLAHFGLSQPPFGITPDTEFVYPSRSHLEGLNLLHLALASGEGFIKVVGEIGTGKTLLCRNFLAELGPQWRAAYIPNPQLQPRELLLEVADELDAGGGGGNASHAIKRINRRLLEMAAEGTQAVICIDEAQTMPRLTLESLRLLSNLETEKRKLLHIVLFGQPELDSMLAAHSARQIRQRIAFQHQLRKLDAGEVAHYVRQRLHIAGQGSEPVFSATALRSLARRAGGTPRLINILAHKAMLVAYGEGVPLVGPGHVRAAAADTEAALRSWWPW